MGVAFIDFQRVQLGSQYIKLIVDLKKRCPQGLERFVSPLLILLVLTCFYLIGDDLRVWTRRRTRRLFGIGKLRGGSPASGNTTKHKAD